MTQPELDFARPLARRSDPSSSWDAAAKAVRSGTVASHEARIYSALVEAAGSPLPYLHPGSRSNAQLVERTGLEMVQVARRTRAMQRRGLIESVRDVHGAEVAPLRWRLPR